MENLETLRIAKAGISKYNEREVRLQDHTGRWLSAWLNKPEDRALLQAAGRTIHAVVKEAYKGDKVYYNIHSFTFEGPAPAVTPQASVPKVTQAKDDSLPFVTPRSMEILIQTCLKEVVATLGLDNAHEEAVRLAYAVRDAAQASPHSKGAVTEAKEQHLAQLQGQAHQADDDIPF